MVKTCLVCGQQVESGYSEDVHRKAHLDRESGYGWVPTDDGREKRIKDWEAELLSRSGDLAEREESLQWREAVVDEKGYVPAESIAHEAYQHVYGDRQAAYGHPSSDFTAMGRISAAILSRWLESQGLVVVPLESLEDPPEGPVCIPDIEPRIVALMMTAVKLSRESAQHKRDNLVDLIGYTLCADRIVEGDDA